MQVGHVIQACEKTIDRFGIASDGVRAPGPGNILSVGDGLEERWAVLGLEGADLRRKSVQLPPRERRDEGQGCTPTPQEVRGATACGRVLALRGWL